MDAIRSPQGWRTLGPMDKADLIDHGRRRREWERQVEAFKAVTDREQEDRDSLLRDRSE